MENFIYSGKNNLDTLTSAINYNNFLENLLLNFVRNEKNVLDFGAGHGEFALRLQKKGINVDCYEIDKEYSHVLRNKKFNVINNESLLKENYYDRIYSMNVLEHIEDDGKSLRNLYNALKTEGKLLLYVPAFPILFSNIDKNVGHFRRYKKQSLINLLENMGFKMVLAEYVDCLGFFCWLLYKWFPLANNGNINSKTTILFDRIIFPLSKQLDYVFKRLFGKNLLLIAKK